MKKSIFSFIRLSQSIKLAAVIVMIVTLLNPWPLMAAPTGGQVTSGKASISQSGATTNIDQATHKAVINWQGFSIGAKETVNFNQPSTKAMTLNRVVGNEKSLIDGALNANGRVFLLNSQGVLIGKGASVKTGGFVASTLDLKDEDFNNDKFVFQGNGLGNGQVLNLGTIKAADGGFVALLGDQVINEGVIVAQKGTVTLNGAKKATLNFNGDSLASVSLDEGTLNALVSTKQAIIADGGQVILTAKAANDLAGSVVNTAGLVEAQTTDSTGATGKILVFAYGGTANIDGTLDASAPKGGNGGFIETSGDKVNIATTAKITTKAEKGQTGTWLIDPKDFTIANRRGDLTGAQVGQYLENNNFKIESSKGSKEGQGNIYVNDVITWTTDNALTFLAAKDIYVNQAISWATNGLLTLDATYGDIYINAPITATGASAGLAMKYANDYHILTPASFSGAILDPVTGYPVAQKDTSGGKYGSVNLPGAAATLVINGVNYQLVHDLAQLQAISGNAGNYALVVDIDLKGNSSFDATGSVINILADTTVLAGLGHKIDNLTINSTLDALNSSYYKGIGLIGRTGTFNSSSNHLIRDLGVTNVDIKNVGLEIVGGLAGYYSGQALNVYTTGKISEETIVRKNQWAHVGGLFGYVFNGLINSSFSKTDVTVFHAVGTLEGALTTIGGLIGAFISLDASSEQYILINSHHEGILISNQNWLTTGLEIKTSIGGLIGNLVDSQYYTSEFLISKSYKIGSIDAKATNSQNIGGLVGHYYMTYIGKFIDTFFDGSIKGGYSIGGLIGNVDARTNQRGLATLLLKIDNSYSNGIIDSNDIGTPTIYDMELQYSSIGGLIGILTDSIPGNKVPASYFIENSHSKMNINGYAAVIGGLIGREAVKDVTIANSFYDGNIHSYFRGTYVVSGAEWQGLGVIGGLVGHTASTNNTYSNNYVSGTIISENTAFIGGLFGILADENKITYSGNYFLSDGGMTSIGMALSSSGDNTQKVGSALSAEYFGDSDAREAILNGGDPISAYETHQTELRQEAIRLENERVERENAFQAELEAQIRAENLAAQVAFQESTIATVSVVADNQKNSNTLVASGPMASLTDFEINPATLEALLSDLTSSTGSTLVSDLIPTSAFSSGISELSVGGQTYVLQGPTTNQLPANNNGLGQDDDDEE
ncbi:MAG: filamentous hemagglutinin N-terminal domain-containing protein [Deltaproteobacteria bacterium]|jgi:filamentous hemagglutinin family protein|nr:filamentous hemagglutinin N-terminal domain-containing protein [Deltaproteobacteria bacterium]